MRGRCFAHRGKTPVTIAIAGTRQKLLMIAGATSQGKARWMIVGGAFNHERLIEFFSLLINDTSKKIFLILDNLGAHHCKPMKAWLAEHKRKWKSSICPVKALSSTRKSASMPT
jgi:hypothetical protein